ncbi:hypothetical protein ADICYQ_5256 [Cyclobacterium qasimii M12-11B]|uniref:Uncharacterized protein n=3 Tax=Cyclobacterium qasimii TaxID=1350429 RepID=S7V748_9BACT|nr:hypothetical protein ADICYQ_5256 [Cyclobacterium qasimii M12-11B]
MVFTVEGIYMKKKKAEALMQRLVQNKISRPEFDELLGSLEDPEMVAGMEESMRKHFEQVLNEYNEELKSNTEDKKIKDQSLSRTQKEKE